MKNLKLTLLGTAALLIAVGLNIRHALNDYGVRDNKLHVEVLAQSNGSGGGGTTDGSGGGSTDDNGGVSTSSETFFWDGKEWNTTDTHKVGSSWMPVKTTCQLQIGFPPYVVIVDGHKITCNKGNGNCLLASSCRNA